MTRIKTWTSLSVIGITQPSHGTLVDNGNGTYTYTPDANFHGSDSITYSISDGGGFTDTAIANITVNTVNDAPNVQDDTYQATQGGALSVTAGVLANDMDVDGDPITVAVVGGPTHGKLTLNADGSFSYTPDAGFVGTDRFS